jgi:segregation and condensation protein B
MSEEILSNGLTLEANLEALLFVAPTSVTLGELASALNIKVSKVKKGLKNLGESYLLAKEKRGVRLQNHRGRYQLTSAPETAQVVEKFLGLDYKTKLSKAALEALAIIIFKQPVTRPQIDGIRGVNSDGVIRNLLSKGLIQELDRADTPGRPILYGTTSDLLQYLGLNSLDEISDLKPDEETAEPIEDEHTNKEEEM